MRIYCDECKGTGKKTTAQAYSGNRGIAFVETNDCPHCHGQGYTEEAVVRVSDVVTLIRNAIFSTDDYTSLLNFLRFKIDSLKGEDK